MNRTLGIFLIVLSAAAFGTFAVLGRWAYDEGLDVFSILFLRFSLAAIFMAGLMAARREAFPRGSVLLRLIGMGAVGYVGQAFSYLTALKYASPGLVALLLYLYPIIVMLLSALFLRERITRAKLIALVLALIGLALTVGPEGGQIAGIVLAILAAVIYSVYIIVGAGVMKQVSPIQSSTVIFAAAGTVSGALMLIDGAHLPTTTNGWAVIGAIVLIPTILAIVTFLAGLERIGPTNASMLSTLEPVVTVLLSVLLLGEVLQPITMAGGALILIAVVVLTRSEMRMPEVL
jgi:drug/metabolite transporter (DMT)-like permease